MSMIDTGMIVRKKSIEIEWNDPITLMSARVHSRELLIR